LIHPSTILSGLSRTRGDWDGKEEREENKAVVQCLSIFILLLLRLPRKALRVIGILGDWEEVSQETERQRDGESGKDAMMQNESRDHRKYVNMYSIDCRTGEESSGSSGLERRITEKG
jgi:hypothetical protein